MLVFFKPTFTKDLKKFPTDIRRKIEEIAKSFSDMANIHNFRDYDIKLISGFKNYYRLRMGNYRIGFKLENKSIIFMRAKHRKDIYKYFP